MIGCLTVSIRVLIIVPLLSAWVPRAASAQTQPPAGLSSIRGAHYPALSPDGKTLCFEYLGDLWTIPAAGGTASRLTINAAYDAYPRWSPDGRWIAFSSNREGNFDVFIMPARGGEARQLTYHSADDIVQDWSPDGSRILFISAREDRYSDLYIIDVKDGRLRRITNDRSQSRYAAFSPDGKMIAYARGRQEWWRPKYRGSANTDIYTIPSFGGATTRWTSYQGMDSFPLYARTGKGLYFVSDRSGTPNIWLQSAPDAIPIQVTHEYKDGVKFPTISQDGSRIAYECNFGITTIGTNGERRTTNGEAHPSSIAIFAPSDLLTNLKQKVTLTSGAQGLALAEDGKNFALAAHGEIWTMPAGGGEAARMTKNSSMEANPAWSPDESKLAYVSDRNGNLDVYLMDTKTKQETQVTLDPADDDRPEFSGSGGLLAFVRTGGTEPGLYVLPIPREGAPKPSEAVRIGLGPGVGVYSWSPDSRWICYAKRDATGTSDLWIVPSVGGTPVNITRFPGINTNPQWSRDGRQLVFTSTRNSPPGTPASNLYAIRLVPPSPDEEERRAGDGARGRGSEIGDDPMAQRRRQRPTGEPAAGVTGPQAAGLPPTGVPPRASEVRIDFDDIQNRARPLTNSREGVGSAALSPDARTVVYLMTVGNETDWWATDVNSGQATRISGGAEPGGTVQFALDGSRFFYLNGQGAIRMMARGAPAPSPVGFTASLEVDRRAELAEAFNEAWRHLRTEFYDPKMHGTDWAALRAKYEPLVSDVVAKEDFAWILQAMIGELDASHTGATPPAEPGVATGYLGLTFDQDYAGPGLKIVDVLPKGPADQIGRHVHVGEYVLQIDGQDVTWGEGIYRPLMNTVGRTVELLVNEKPVKDGAHAVKITPISHAAELDLAYERWVEERRRKVDGLSGGQLAYIHIRAMDQPSLQKFQRELFGDAQGKKGLVLDVRFNGGGRIHDDLLGILTRKAHVYEIPRDAERSTQPFQLWDRPIVLLINEQSASDAEIFPNGFREYGLGKIVGVPTYGGVIGTVDITLVDGTRFRVPRTGWYTLEGQNLEHFGVPPDVRVEMAPDDYAKDDDKQLQAAVKLLMDQMNAKR